MRLPPRVQSSRIGDIDTVFTSLPQYLGAFALMVGAQTVYVLFGFGAGLIAMGGMAVFMPEVADIVVILLLVSLPAEVFVVSRSQEQISWSGVLVLASGVAIGVVAGAHLLESIEPTFVLTLLAGFLIAVGIAFLLVPNQARVHWPRWCGAPVGVVSGVLAGLFGTGAPPLILYYQLAGIAKSRFRGQLMAIFLLISFVRVPTYALLGLLTVPRLFSAGALLPAALLGAWLGHRVHLGISEVRFRQLVSVALCVLGILLLARP